MKKPAFHILVCNSYRVAGSAQGACNRKNAPAMIQFLTEGAAERGLDSVVTGVGCLNVCAQGPVVVVHPHNLWYGGVESEDDMDAILDAMENGEVAEKYLISE